MKKFDNLLLSIGAAKCGTTWLHTSLCQHPEIKHIPIKEINYFTAKYVQPERLSKARRMTFFRNLVNNNTRRILNNLQTGESDIIYQNLIKKIDWYRIYLEPEISDEWFLNLFQFADGKYMVDFGNQLFRLLEKDFEEISAQTANLKVLYTIRRPSKRLWSHVKFHETINRNAPQDFSKLTQSEFLTLVKKSNLDEHGNYSDVNNRLRNALDPSQFDILIFEELISKPVESLRKIENFVDIEQFGYDPEKLSKKVNASISAKPNEKLKLLLEEVDNRQYEALDKIGFDLPKSWLN